MRQAEAMPVTVEDKVAQNLLERLAPGLYDAVLDAIESSRDGIAASGIRVYSTTEGDDPTWEELAFEVRVTAERQDASCYWDRISDELQRLMDVSQGPARDQLIQSISVIVRRS